MYKKNLILILIALSNLQLAFSININNESEPFLGAQVIIECGQTPEDIDALFATLKQHNMTFCRIRMFESYMHDGAGNWDFKVFDYAFESAKRHNIMIFATLFPMVEFTNIGGFKFPGSQEHLNSIAEYIKQVVTHFKTYPSFAGWVLINEIGTGKAPLSKPFTARKFAEWQKVDSVKPFLPNGKPVMQFQEERFLLYYNTWYLGWLKSEVRKYDTKSHLHVNTHAIFDTYSEYDFPKWRTILDSFGGSAHAGWHFGYFTRNNYHYAMAANSEILRSGAGGKPWIMTELQGGNNIWSGGHPMCPTKNEIEQWVWTVIGSGGKGLIFWSLNARTAGLEAGEWALLDLQNQPTDRLETVSKVAATIKQRANLFSSARVQESGVNILYTRESLWSEQRAETSGSDYAGRKPGAAIKSVIGFYESLAQMGIQANIKCIDEFNFEVSDNSGKVIILPHQIAVSASYAPLLEKFAKKGGLVIVEGLTAFYSEHMQLQLSQNEAFRSLLGGYMKDVKMLEQNNYIKLESQKVTLPFHWWQTTINSQKSSVLAKTPEGHPLVTTYSIGQGRVVWLPSLVALQARETKNYKPLTEFLSNLVCPFLAPGVLHFDRPHEQVLMLQLNSDNQTIIILINKATKKQTIALNTNQMLFDECIYPQHKKTKRTKIEIQPEETVVYLLRNKSTK